MEIFLGENSGADYANMSLFSLIGLGIKEYNGEDEHQPLHAFLESIEKVRISRPATTEAELVRLAVSKCTGHAFGVVRNSYSSFTSLEQLERALQVGCGVYDNPDACEMQLLTCKQERNESVNEYYRRICMIQQKFERSQVAPAETNEEKRLRTEEVRAKVLKRGLLPRYRDEIRRKDIKEVDMILQFALQEEFHSSSGDQKLEEMVAALLPMLEKKLTLQKQLVTRDRSLSIAAVPFHPSGEHHQQVAFQDHWQQQQSEHGALKQVQRGDNQQSSNWELAPFQRSQQRNSMDTYNRNNNFNQQLPSEIFCYNCNKPGHYKSRCLAPVSCQYCGASEHSIYWCPKIPCTACNSLGHTPRHCNNK